MTTTIEQPESYPNGVETRRLILEMGLRLWCADRSYCTARRIAHEMGLSSHSAVLYHFKHSQGMIDAIAYHAVQQDESRVIVHLIAMQHKAVAHLDDAQRLEYMKAAKG